MGIGKEAIRKGLVESGGAKVVGSECAFGEQSSTVDSVMVRVFLSYICSCILTILLTYSRLSKSFILHRQIRYLVTLSRTNKSLLSYTRRWVTSLLRK